MFFKFKITIPLPGIPPLTITNTEKDAARQRATAAAAAIVATKAAIAASAPATGGTSALFGTIALTALEGAAAVEVARYTAALTEEATAPTNRP